MGCGGSKEDTSAKERSDAIEAQLKKDRMNMRNEIKMLLLGAGESGKSTVLKQMKLIHEGSYSPEERESYIEIILSNTIQSMHVILDAMEMMGIGLQDQSNRQRANVIMGMPHQIEGDSLNPEVTDAVAGLWRDAGVQQCFERSREFQLNDSAKYYFDSIQRIGAPDYLPSDQDVLRSRVKTTGITESHFQIGELKYKLFDVGGQRSERKKWIHCFENVTAILFLVAISEYDLSLIEDESVNRMQESLALFDSICNSRWFVKTSIILFLNKIDLFKQKIQHSPVRDYFPDFTGQPGDVQAGCEYFSHRFQSLNQNPAKQVYVHLTCATDTNQLKYVLSCVNDIIIQSNLRDCGLL